MRLIRISILASLICGTILSWNKIGYCQVEDDSASSAKVDAIMQRALARCYSTVDGVAQITWEPPTREEINQIIELNEHAVGPLAKYLNQRDDFTQLFAVKFLIATGLPSTSEPLKVALTPDRWEVTRAQALSGLYQLSKVEARLYIEADRMTSRPLSARGITT